MTDAPNLNGGPSQGEIPFEEGNAGDERRAKLYMGLLWLYVVLLAVGTIGELLDIKWILDLPIY